MGSGDGESELPTRRVGRRLSAGIAIASFLLALALWLPAVHLVYRPSLHEITPPAAGAPAPAKARRLAARHLALWSDPAARAREIERMRRSNAEWDFMGRSFLVWALANMALAEPEQRPALLAAIDAILDETLALERREGVYHFLMPYARRREFVMQPVRSQFTDGEIALMIALRRLVEDKEELRAPLAERVAAMTARMEKSPTLSAESYPDECWTFCNTVALAAIRASDVLDGTDHEALFRRWIEVARDKLTDPTTGLLVSSYTLDGKTLDGPEGSSLWVDAHMLEVIDHELAADQYARAKRALAGEVVGFGYAREWPASRRGPADVDSGPPVPLLDASAGSSGLAFVGAATFGDTEWLASLHTTLDFAAFPTEAGGGLRYAAGNATGDAVLLYSMVMGPAWARLARRSAP